MTEKENFAVNADTVTGYGIYVAVQGRGQRLALLKAVIILRFPQKVRNVLAS